MNALLVTKTCSNSDMVISADLSVHVPFYSDLGQLFWKLKIVNKAETCHKGTHPVLHKCVSFSLVFQPFQKNSEMSQRLILSIISPSIISSIAEISAENLRQWVNFNLGKGSPLTLTLHSVSVNAFCVWILNNAILFRFTLHSLRFLRSLRVKRSLWSSSDAPNTAAQNCKNLICLCCEIVSIWGNIEARL